MGGATVLEDGPRTRRLDDVVRVGAVDDHPMLLEGLRHALTDDGIEFVGSAADVATLLESSGRLDVVLLDLRLDEDERSGQDVRDAVSRNVRTLVDAGVTVVAFTRGERDGEAAAIREGAHGVLLKNRSLAEVRAAVLSAARGEELAFPETAQALERSRVLLPHLSPREVETLRLYASGLAAKQVARRMGVKEGTTKEFLSRIRAKYRALGRTAVTRMDLYRLGVADGVIDPTADDPDAPTGGGGEDVDRLP